jgi:hypothetical protein
MPHGAWLRRLEGRLGKNPAVRKTFFDCIRSKAIPKLVNLGFPKEKSAELERRLDEINRNYLAA